MSVVFENHFLLVTESPASIAPRARIGDCVEASPRAPGHVTAMADLTSRLELRGLTLVPATPGMWRVRKAGVV